MTILLVAFHAFRLRPYRPDAKFHRHEIDWVNGLDPLEEHAVVHRSYRLEATSIGAEEMGRVVGTTWKSMGPQDKAPYERVASEELGRYMDAKRTFEAAAPPLQHSALRRPGSRCIPAYTFATFTSYTSFTIPSC